METIRINGTSAVNLVLTKREEEKRKLNDEKCYVSINNTNKLKINWVSKEMVHHGCAVLGTEMKMKNKCFRP